MPADGVVGFVVAWRKSTHSVGACLETAVVDATIVGGRITGYTLVSSPEPGPGATTGGDRSGAGVHGAGAVVVRRSRGPLAGIRGQAAGRSGAGIRLDDLRRAADTAAEDAETELGIQADAPGPRPGPELDQYCLTMAEHLARELFPDGIGARGIRDDAVLGAGQGAHGFLGLPTTAWVTVTSWQALTEAIDHAGPGTVAIVVIGRRMRAPREPGGPVPATLSHTIVLTHTSDNGITVTDPARRPGPHSPRHDTRPLTDTAGSASGTAADRLGPLADTRALIIGPAGRIIAPPRTGLWGPGPGIGALTDPTDPRAGSSPLAPSGDTPGDADRVQEAIDANGPDDLPGLPINAGATDATTSARVAEHAENLIDRMSGGSITGHDIADVDLAVRPQVFAVIQEQHPGEYRTWRRETGIHYGRARDVPNGVTGLPITATDTAARVAQHADNLIDRMNRGSITANDLLEVDPAVRPRIFTEIQERHPGEYRTWRQGNATRYGRAIDVPNGRTSLPITAPDIDVRVAQHADNLIDQMNSGPLTGRGLGAVDVALRSRVFAEIQERHPGEYWTWRRGKGVHYARTSDVPNGVARRPITDAATDASAIVRRYADSLIQSMDGGPITASGLSNIDSTVRPQVFAEIQWRYLIDYRAWQQGGGVYYGRTIDVPNEVTGLPITATDTTLTVARHADTLTGRMNRGPITANELRDIDSAVRPEVFTEIERRNAGAYRTWWRGGGVYYGRTIDVPNEVTGLPITATDAALSVARHADTLTSRMNQGPITPHDIHDIDLAVRPLVFAAIEDRYPRAYRRWWQGGGVYYGRVQDVPLDGASSLPVGGADPPSPVVEAGDDRPGPSPGPPSRPGTGLGYRSPADPGSTVLGRDTAPITAPAGFGLSPALRLEDLWGDSQRLPGDCLMHALLDSALGWLPPNARTVQEIRDRLADALEDPDTPQYRENLEAQALRFLAEDHADRWYRRNSADWLQVVHEYSYTHAVDWDQIITDLRTPGSWENAAGDIAPVLAGWIFNLRINVHQGNNAHPYVIGDEGGYPIFLRRTVNHWQSIQPLDDEEPGTGIPPRPTASSSSTFAGPAQPAQDDRPGLDEMEGMAAGSNQPMDVDERQETIDATGPDGLPGLPITAAATDAEAEASVKRYAETLIERMDEGLVTGPNVVRDLAVRPEVLAEIQRQHPGEYQTWWQGKNVYYARTIDVPDGVTGQPITANDAALSVARHADALIRRMNSGRLSGDDLRAIDRVVRPEVFAEIQNRHPGEYQTWRQHKNVYYARTIDVPDGVTGRPITDAATNASVDGHVRTVITLMNRGPVTRGAIRRIDVAVRPRVFTEIQDRHPGEYRTWWQDGGSRYGRARDVPNGVTGLPITASDAALSVARHADALIRHMKSGPITGQAVHDLTIDLAVRPRVFAEIQDRHPGEYRTWRQGDTTYYGRTSDVPSEGVSIQPVGGVGLPGSGMGAVDDQPGPSQVPPSRPGTASGHPSPARPGSSRPVPASLPPRPGPALPPEVAPLSPGRPGDSQGGSSSALWGALDPASRTGEADPVGMALDPVEAWLDGRSLRRLPVTADRGFLTALVATADPGALLDLDDPGALPDLDDPIQIREYLAAQLLASQELRDGMTPAVQRFLAERSADQHIRDQRAVHFPLLQVLTHEYMLVGQPLEQATWQAEDDIAEFIGEREALVESYVFPVSEQQWEEIARQIRTPDSWAGIDGDIIPLLAALVFDLRITVVDNGDARPVGNGHHGITLVRTGDHWDATLRVV